MNTTRKSLTEPMSLVFQPHAFNLGAILHDSSAKSRAFFFIFKLAVIVSLLTFDHYFFSTTFKLALLPQSVKVCQQPSVNVQCHLLHVFVQVLKFLED